jgi:hypothetical protein
MTIVHLPLAKTVTMASSALLSIPVMAEVLALEQQIHVATVRNVRTTAMKLFACAQVLLDPRAMMDSSAQQVMHVMGLETVSEVGILVLKGVHVQLLAMKPARIAGTQRVKAAMMAVLVLLKISAMVQETALE